MTIKEYINKEKSKFGDDDSLILIIGINKLHELIPTISGRLINVERIKDYQGLPVIINEFDKDACSVVCGAK